MNTRIADHINNMQSSLNTDLGSRQSDSRKRRLKILRDFSVVKTCYCYILWYT